MKLFFDTETTGKADFRSQPDADHQPRIVQLGAILTEDDGTEVATLDVIIRPGAFVIPADAALIHGITTEKAMRCGVAMVSALEMLADFAAAADTVIAHNIEFDAFMAQIEEFHASFNDRPLQGKHLQWTGDALP